jgi:hypothetical protein
MSDSFTISTSAPPVQRSPSRRHILWEDLEQLHERRLMDPPIATLTLEDLEAEVERVRLLLRGVQHASNE